MGKHRSLEDRLSYAERQAQRNARAVDKHQHKLALASAKQQIEKAEEAMRLRDRAKQQQAKWLRLASRLRKQIVVRDALNRRAPESGKGVPCSPVQKVLSQREERARAEREVNVRRRMASAAVDWDPRTANGRRTFDLVSLGPTMRAFVNHFNSCIKRKADRTEVRMLAWNAFDRHFHRVQEGLLPEPRFEPGVDTSGIPGVADSRLDALRDDRELRADLGRDMHSLLVEVVYHQRRLSELPGLEGMESRDRTALLLRALDVTAAYWNLNNPDIVRHRAERVLVSNV